MKVKNHLDTLEYNEALQPWMKNSLKRKSRICKFTETWKLYQTVSNTKTMRKTTDFAYKMQYAIYIWWINLLP